MWGGYVWSSAAMGIIVMGVALAYFSYRYVRHHACRPLAQRRAEAALRANRRVSAE